MYHIRIHKKYSPGRLIQAGMWSDSKLFTRQAYTGWHVVRQQVIHQAGLYRLACGQTASYLPGRLIQAGMWSDSKLFKQYA